MATTTESVAASDHASATDEQIVNKEKSEAIADEIASLANEDEVKHDKPEEANGNHAVPSSKTEGNETNGELRTVEVQRADDSPALEAFAEDNLKDNKTEDVPTLAAPLSKTEEDDGKAEPAVVVVEKTDDPLSLEADIEENLKEEKEVIPDSHIVSGDEAKSQPEEAPSAEPTVEETPAEVEKLLKTVDFPEASAETNENSTNTPEANPQIESEPEVVKEAEILETSDQKEELPEPEAVAKAVQEKIEEPEKESQEKPQEAEQPTAVTILEPTAEANPQTESEAEVVKEAEILDQKEEKLEAEPVVAAEVHEKTEEPEEESKEKPQEAEQPSTVTIPGPSTEADAVEEKTRELPVEETLKETNDSETVPSEIVTAERVVTEVEENQKEQEKQSLEQKEEEQPSPVAIAEVPSTETSEAIEEKTSEPEVLKEEPIEAELEVTKVDENSVEAEKEPIKEDEEEELPKTVIPETETAGDTVEVHPPPKESDIEEVKEIDNSESEAVPGEAEKLGDVTVVHQPAESDIEVVKETSTSELEAVHVKEEKTEPVSIEAVEKPREVIEVAEDVGEPKKEAESEQEIALENTKIEETSDDTIKDTISFKEEKTDKEDETKITANTAQVSSNEEAEAATENPVEPSPEVAEKVVEEDDKKESRFTDVIEEVAKDEAGILKIPEQASIDQEAKTDLKEEKELAVPSNVEEKVAAAENDDKKEPEALEAVQVSSRDVEVEINKDEKPIEGKIATNEDDRPAVQNIKEEHIETKVDEISSAVSEPVRETLASKFEKEENSKTDGVSLEKEQSEEPVKTEVQVPEEPTKESDATKTSSKDLPKETPTKPAQKQSNNIISKVKQSLVKARKAIIGKSPSSKNHSTEAKDDIQVK